MQEKSGESKDVRGSQGRLCNLLEVRRVQGNPIEFNGHQEGPGRFGMSFEKKKIKGYSNQV